MTFWLLLTLTLFIWETIRSVSGCLIKMQARNFLKYMSWCEPKMWCQLRYCNKRFKSYKIIWKYKLCQCEQGLIEHSKLHTEINESIQYMYTIQLIPLCEVNTLYVAGNVDLRTVTRSGHRITGPHDDDW
jgi:hypothetical protein